jgi:hypothetical protein
MAGCGSKGMKKGYKMGGMVKKMGESSKTMSDDDKARMKRGMGESSKTMSDDDKARMKRGMGESSKTMSDADKRYAMGGMVGYAKGGKVDQSMCSPRKQMAMGKKAMK